MPGQSRKQEFVAKIKELGGVTALLERRASGQTWAKIAEPIGCSRQWLTFRFLGAAARRSETLKEAIALANREYAESLAEEGLTLVDDVVPDKDHVAKVKLQVEHRRWLAGVYDRERFGEAKQVAPSPLSIGELHIQALIQPARPAPAPLPSGPSVPVERQLAVPVSEE